MDEVESESIKTVSTVRTFLWVILVLLVASLIFQWTAVQQNGLKIRSLEDRLRDLEIDMKEWVLIDARRTIEMMVKDQLEKERRNGI